MMLSGDHSDLIIKVKGEEFRLHKSILVARSAFFESRFKNEVQEITPGTLIIDDCEPSYFSSLIYYLYTGSAENLCPENVCGLYEVSLTYQVEQMKSECIQFMMSTISIDNFCDYTALALKHDEKELFQKAVELFTHKGKEITDNVNWKTFLEKYPAQANELYEQVLCQREK